MPGPEPYEELRRLARSYEQDVPAASARRAAAAALMAAKHPRRRFRLAPVFASFLTIIAGNAGLALAADPALPGDLFYPIDRFYERVVELTGLGADVRTERIAEAAALHAKGQLALAVATAGEAVAGLAGAENAGLTDAVAALNADAAPGQALTAALHEETNQLVDLAAKVVEAAKTGDPGDASEAAAELRKQAADVVIAAQDKEPPGQTTDPGSPGTNNPGTPPTDRGSGQSASGGNQ